MYIPLAQAQAYLATIFAHRFRPRFYKDTWDIQQGFILFLCNARHGRFDLQYKYISPRSTCLGGVGGLYVQNYQDTSNEALHWLTTLRRALVPLYFSQASLPEKFYLYSSCIFHYQLHFRNYGAGGGILAHPLQLCFSSMQLECTFLVLPNERG